MTFLEYLKKSPTAYRAPLAWLDRHRLAELADRGDSAEIGRIVFHAMEAEKYTVETELDTGRGAGADAIAADWDPGDGPLPIMLRSQAD
ncbi:MAG TPA: hypothetical protein VGA88_14535 [Burkholderiales bacterium]